MLCKAFQKHTGTNSLRTASPSVKRLGKMKGLWKYTGTPNDKGTYKRRCRSMRLFYLHKTVKIQPFYPFFFINGIHTKISCWVIPLKFQGIKHQPFPMAQPYKNPATALGDPHHSPITPKMPPIPHLRWGIR